LQCTISRRFPVLRAANNNNTNTASVGGGQLNTQKDKFFFHERYWKKYCKNKGVAARHGAGRSGREGAARVDFDAGEKHSRGAPARPPEPLATSLASSTI
jgi:hypothetical protein